MVELVLTAEWQKARQWPLIVNYHDLDGANHSTSYWIERYRKRSGAEIVWYTGADSVAPQERYGGRCEIEATWDDGARLMREERFLIVPRKATRIHGRSRCRRSS